MDDYNYNPGPGTYKPSVWYVKTLAPIYSIALRSHWDRREQVPGPGTYEPRILGRREPAYTLPAQNDVRMVNTNPAPNAYDPSHQITKHAASRYTIATKLRTLEIDKTPGPGTYKPQRQGYGSAFTIAQRPRNEKVNESPSPAHYNPLIHWYRPGFTLGKRFPGGHPPNFPAPNAYSPKIVGVRGAAFTIGKKWDLSIDQEFPGPGSYEPWHRPGKAYTIAKKFKERPKFSEPGAGEYDPEIRPGKPAFTIAARKEDDLDNHNPGPGTYDPRLDGIPGYTIGMRFQDRPPNNVPGPGTYHNPKLAKFTGPAYSLTARAHADRENENPAPNTYDPIYPKKGGVIIAERLNTPESLSTPGPGSYNLRLKKFGGPAFTIATRLTKRPRPGEKGYVEMAPKVF